MLAGWRPSSYLRARKRSRVCTAARTRSASRCEVAALRSAAASPQLGPKLCTLLCVRGTSPQAGPPRGPACEDGSAMHWGTLPARHSQGQRRAARRSLLLLAPGLLATTGRPALVQAVTADTCAQAVERDGASAAAIPNRVAGSIATLHPAHCCLRMLCCKALARRLIRVCCRRRARSARSAHRVLAGLSTRRSAGSAWPSAKEHTRDTLRLLQPLAARARPEARGRPRRPLAVRLELQQSQALRAACSTLQFPGTAEVPGPARPAAIEPPHSAQHCRCEDAYPWLLRQRSRRTLQKEGEQRPCRAQKLL